MYLPEVGVSSSTERDMMGIFSIRDLFGDKMVSQTVWDGTTVSSEGGRESKVIVYERMAGLSTDEECTSMSRPTGGARWLARTARCSPPLRARRLHSVVCGVEEWSPGGLQPCGREWSKGGPRPWGMELVSTWCGEAATQCGNLSEKPPIMCLAIAVPPIAFGPEASTSSQLS